MIMHSYGGLVGCEALKEMDLEEQEKRKKKPEVENSVKATADGKTLRRGRVLQLGFIAGLAFPVGRSTLSPTFAADKKVKGFTCVVRRSVPFEKTHILECHVLCALETNNRV